MDHKSSIAIITQGLCLNSYTLIETAELQGTTELIDGFGCSKTAPDPGSLRSIWPAPRPLTLEVALHSSSAELCFQQDMSLCAKCSCCSSCLDLMLTRIHCKNGAPFCKRSGFLGRQSSIPSRLSTYSLLVWVFTALALVSLLPLDSERCFFLSAASCNLQGCK